MMYVVPYEAGHIARMRVQAAQAWLVSRQAPAVLRSLENEYASTLMVDGTPIACAGAVPLWEGRAYVWSWIGDSVCTANFRAVHRHAKEFLAGLPFRRLEATVDCAFEAGHRWVKALGFTMEAPRMVAFEVDGRDSALYARVGA